MGNYLIKVKKEKKLKIDTTSVVSFDINPPPPPRDSSKKFF